jgi:hypothetical protein
MERFDHYLKNIPPYYYAVNDLSLKKCTKSPIFNLNDLFFQIKPLRRVLAKKGLQHLIPENLENCLSVQVQSYLKKVKTQVWLLFFLCFIFILSIC